MNLSITLIFSLLFYSLSTAQLATPVINGVHPSAPSYVTMIHPQEWITVSKEDFVSHLDFFLESELQMTLFQKGQHHIDSQFQSSIFKYKLKSDEELLPQKEFLQFEVHTFLLDVARVDTVRITGSGALLKAFYASYWNIDLPFEMNDSGELLTWSNANDKMVLMMRKSSSPSTVELLVTAPNLTTPEAKSRLSEFLTKAKMDLERVKIEQSQRIYSWSTKDTSYYNSVKNYLERNLAHALIDGALENGTCELIVDRSIDGKNTIETKGISERLSDQFVSSITNSAYSNVDVKGVSYRTRDTFLLNFNSITQRVEMIKNKQRVRVYSINDPRIERIAKKEALKSNSEHCNIDVLVNLSEVNGKEFSESRVTNLEAKASAGQVVAIVLFTPVIIWLAILSTDDGG